MVEIRRKTHFHKPYEPCFDDKFPEKVQCPKPWYDGTQKDDWCGTLKDDDDERDGQTA